MKSGNKIDPSAANVDNNRVSTLLSEIKILSGYLDEIEELKYIPGNLASIPSNIEERVNKKQQLTAHYFEKLQQFLNNLTISDLRTPIATKEYGNISLLMYLSLISPAHENSQLFCPYPIYYHIWKRFIDQLSIDDLREEIPKGALKGQSVLWMIACNVYYCNLSAIEQSNSTITLEDKSALEKMREPDSVANLYLASYHNYDVMLSIWEKWKAKITADDLTAYIGKIKPNFSSRNASYTILDFLTYKINQSASIKQMVIDIFAHTQATWEHKHGRPQYAELFAIISQKKRALISAVNTAIDEFEKNNQLTEAAHINLAQLAYNADEAGYLNAYYHLAMFYTHANMHERAIKFYKMIPRKSCFYSQAMEEAIELLYNHALEQPILSERNKYLCIALEFALKIDEVNVKTDHIQKLYYSYSSKGKASFVDFRSLIPPDVLTLVVDQHSGVNVFKGIQNCIEVFARNRALEARLAKAQSLLKQHQIHFDEEAIIPDLSTSTPACPTASLSSPISSLEPGKSEHAPSLSEATTTASSSLVNLSNDNFINGDLKAQTNTATRKKRRVSTHKINTSIENSQQASCSPANSSAPSSSSTTFCFPSTIPFSFSGHALVVPMYNAQRNQLPMPMPISSNVPPQPSTLTSTAETGTTTTTTTTIPSQFRFTRTQ